LATMNIPGIINRNEENKNEISQNCFFTGFDINCIGINPVGM
jgi:hypothetical protein